MAVMRVHKDNNFTMMKNYHFREKRMSLKAKGLLSLMLSLPDDWDYSVSGLVTLSKDGRDAVMAGLVELETFGYLQRVQKVNEKGQFTGVEYDIYEEPQQELAIAENSTSDNSTSGKPISEKMIQLNTNSTKNLFNKLYNELSTKGDEELIELYKDYIVMRKAIDSPLTAAGLDRLMKKCEKLSYGNINVQKLILENAIINNWKDIYVPRESELTRLNQRFVGDLRAMFEME